MVRDIRERHRYMDSDEFNKAAGKADKGERLGARDLIFLLPPDRVLHREVEGNTTAFVKGLPLDAGESTMLDVFSSFGGMLRNTQCVIFDSRTSHCYTPSSTSSRAISSTRRPSAGAMA